MGDAAQQPSRRAKHRKEVKRYYERQQNKELRRRAQDHDSILFLFGDSDAAGNGVGRQVEGEPEKHEGSLLVGAAGDDADGVKEHHPPLLEDRPGNGLTTDGDEPDREPSVAAVAAGAPATETPAAVGAAEESFSPHAFEPHSGAGDPVGDDAMDDWNFDFVFRSKAQTGSGLFEGTVDGAAHSTHENAIVPSSFYAEMSRNDEEGAGGGSDRDVVVAAAADAAAASSLIPRQHNTSARDKRFSPQQQAQAPVFRAALPIASGVGGAPPKAPNRIHVRRVEGVPALPVEGPLPPGTDINMPTSNYLTMDPTYNIHQHAPGFVRNEKVAIRTLLSNAFTGWRDVKESTMVLSTGEAMRAVFQQAYADGKPLALKVQRIGPTLIVDTHGEQPSSVREMREKSLLGKALYRMEDALLHQAVSPDAAATATAARDAPEAKAPESTGALTVAPQRVGAVVPASKAVNRFSQTLRWNIDGLDVLVGVDTPIVLDRRNNAEQVLKLEDVSQRISPADTQRETLNCWFDATLANVPQVGIYIHNAGVVQSFEVKKVQELLGLGEGRIATVAMNFTSNFLQWLVTQCDRDNASYVVLRNYAGDSLDLFELPGAQSTNLLADLLADDDGAAAAAASAGDKNGSPTSSEAEQTERTGQRRKYEEMQLQLAKMCFGMGEQLYREGALRKAQDAVALLLRSFTIFLQQPDAAGAVDRVDDTSGMLPSLMGRLVEQYQLSSNGAVRPEAFRDAMLACGRFECRLRQALENASDDHVTQRRYVRCLLPCSAAMCVVVARTLDAFNTCRCECVSRGQPVCRGRQCVLAAAEPSDVDNTPCGPAKDLLQVVVEGLVRLEQLNGAITQFVAAHQQAEGQRQQRTARAASRSNRSKRRKGEAAGGGASGGGGAIIDPATHINLDALNASLAELFGDLILLAMSDKSTFTAQVLREISRRLTGRANAVVSGRSRHRRPHVNGSVATGMPTTLQWLAQLPTDTISLSFTALRLFSKAGPQTRRLLLKTAQVYFLLGRFHARTDRYTKALEALHRAKSLFKASENAQADACFGECFCSAPLVTLPDVFRALGDVYARMAELKARASTAVARAVVTQHQPLSVGATHVQEAEEKEFLQRAMDAYGEGGWYRQRAVMLLRDAGAAIDTVTLRGTPADAATAQRIYDSLSSLKDGQRDGSRPHQLLWEWEMLRLFTCTALGGAPAGMLRDARAVGHAWEKRLSGSLVVVGPDQAAPVPLAPLQGAKPGAAPLSSAASTSSDAGSARAAAMAPPEKARVATVPHDKGFTVSLVEQNLQLALAHCVAAEACDAGAIRRTHVRLTLTFTAAALDAVADGDEMEHLSAAARVWGAGGWSELAARIGSMVCVRALKAATDAAPATGEAGEACDAEAASEMARVRRAIAAEVVPLLETNAAVAKERLQALVHAAGRG